MTPSGVIQVSGMPEIQNQLLQPLQTGSDRLTPLLQQLTVKILALKECKQSIFKSIWEPWASEDLDYAGLAVWTHPMFFFPVVLIECCNTVFLFWDTPEIFLGLQNFASHVIGTRVSRSRLNFHFQVELFQPRFNQVYQKSPTMTAATVAEVQGGIVNYGMLVPGLTKFALV